MVTVAILFGPASGAAPSATFRPFARLVVPSCLGREEVDAFLAAVVHRNFQVLVTEPHNLVLRLTHGAKGTEELLQDFLRDVERVENDPVVVHRKTFLDFQWISCSNNPVICYFVSNMRFTYFVYISYSKINV